MKKSVLLITGIVLVVLLFVGVYFLYGHLSEDYSPNIITDNNSGNSSSTNESQQTEQNAAPDFTVVDDKGNEVSLSDYFGKPIVLNFWASWCPPCKSEMPHFESAFKENTDVQFLMVNVTASDNMADAKAFIEQEGYTFPVLFDTRGNAANTYGASSLPTTFFIDKNGNIATYAVGMLSAESLDNGIEMIKQ